MRSCPYVGWVLRWLTFNQNMFEYTFWRHIESYKRSKNQKLVRPYNIILELVTRWASKYPRYNKENVCPLMLLLNRANYAPAGLQARVHHKDRYFVIGTCYIITLTGTYVLNYNII